MSDSKKELQKLFSKKSRYSNFGPIISEIRVKGFRGFWDIEGGDDSVFINTYATGENTKVVIDSNAITQSSPKENWKEYFLQEKHQLHAERFFRVEDKRKMGLYGISHALYWIGGLGLLIYFAIDLRWEYFLVVLGLLGLRSIVLISIFKAASKNLQGNPSKMNVLVNDLLYLAYFWVLGSISYQAKTTK
jgi:hypothetical protein